jgi:hypothetical protein
MQLNAVMCVICDVTSIFLSIVNEYHGRHRSIKQARRKFCMSIPLTKHPTKSYRKIPYSKNDFAMEIASKAINWFSRVQ